MYTNKNYFWNTTTQIVYLQSTLTLILLLTVGGTPLLAIHKYAPISNREILVNSSVSPSHSETETKNT